ncbi:hypothetical protein [Amnibacterium kyonggiense]|uniref:Uncharacterized protein n=1 Tax=Amnibacterium kyonggiense TaxID=595671 RepID=A0A4R7FPS9_9MICO|nr:hypothetical protein [Amnibacterium kyonggiense]TDS79760.1 hypothetical protein CLV52_0302 [Amnibacterium kyonggiense]
MDSDVTGSSNPGPEEGEHEPHRQGTEDPGPGGTTPGQGSGNPGPAEPEEADEPRTGSENPGPRE